MRGSIGRGLAAVLLVLITISARSYAATEPPAIRIRLDFRNVLGPAGQGALSAKKGAKLLTEVNDVWSQCGIQFRLRRFGNESAKALALPYPPQSMDDLSVIAQKLNPRGFREPNLALPLTIAGPWSFVYNGVWLNGLGWVFTNAQNGVDKIGAMMSAKKLDAPEGGLILAHELGHALSLAEGGDGTLMGPGTPFLSVGQCQQTRSFALRYLGQFIIDRDRLAPDLLAANQQPVIR